MYRLNMLAIAIELARRESRLRGHGQQVLGALPLHRPRDAASRGQATTSRSGTKRTASSTTCCTCPTDALVPLKIRSVVGLIPLLRGRDARAGAARRSCQAFSRRLEWFIANRPDLTANVASMTTPGRGERRLLSIVSTGAAAPRAAGACSTNVSSCRRTASARCRDSTRTAPYRLRGQRHDLPRGLRAGRIDDRDCSAATRTGAGRSGFRSIS